MSTTKTNHIDSCPACGDVDIDEAIEGFDGVCSECGFVIHESTNTKVPDLFGVGEASEDQEDEEWMAICRVRNATEQQLAQAFDILEDIGEYLELPATLRRDIAEIYCDAFLAETTDGRDTATVIAACVRLASLQNGRPIPTGRLRELSEVDEQQFRHSYNALCNDLNQTPPIPEPVDYLPFLARTLSLNDERVKANIRILEDVTGSPSLVGKDPGGVAAAASYLTGERKTQQEVAEACGVSTETVRQRVTQLRELLNDG